MPDRNLLNELRAALAESRRLVNRKVKRIERSGVDIERTKQDPRTKTPVNKLTTKQIQSELKRNATFRSRKTQFVADTFGRPIPRHVWRAYVKAENAGNELSKRTMAKVKDVEMPHTGMTIGQHEAATRSEFPRTADPAVNTPYKTVKRRPDQIASQKALERLTKQQQRKVDPRYQKQLEREGRAQLAKMMRTINDPELEKRIKKLTTNQFNMAWQFGGLADDASLWFNVLGGSGKGATMEDRSNTRYGQKIVSDSINGIGEKLTWAESQPKQR